MWDRQPLDDVTEASGHQLQLQYASRDQEESPHVLARDQALATGAAYFRIECPVDITFFERPEEFREWLAAHHASGSELLVGFYKKGSGKPSITWPESVDQALCFGWIDGVRKRIDESSYMIRFTPRKARSIWSAVNIKRVEELMALGLMQPAGLRAFEQRSESRSKIYAYEQENHGLSPEFEARFRADETAWAFFQAQAAWYRRNAMHWVMRAKKEETRERRLATLIDDSAHGRRLGHLSYGDRK